MFGGTNQQFVFNENNGDSTGSAQMLGSTNQQFVFNQNNQLIATEDSYETLDTTMINNDERSSSVLASILATLNVLTDEVRKLRAESSESTKKIDEIYDIIKGGNTQAILNRRNEPKANDFLFAPIGTVADATIVEKLLGEEDYKDKLVRIYELLLSFNISILILFS